MNKPAIALLLLICLAYPRQVKANELVGLAIVSGLQICFDIAGMAYGAGLFGKKPVEKDEGYEPLMLPAPVEPTAKELVDLWKTGAQESLKEK